MMMQVVAKTDTAETKVDPGPRLINRELSWLDASERVLDLAADPSLPLLERVKFCGIFSDMHDEFFMVRVAGLMDQAASGLGMRSADGLTPQQALASIRERVTSLAARQSKLWRRELRPALAENGIDVAGLDECGEKELAALATRFDREIYPVLTPLGVGLGQPFPYISGLSLSLGVLAVDPETGEERFARVKVPEGLPRFVEVGKKGRLVPLEAVIGHFLPSLFPGMDIAERATFRVTRDADFDVSDDAADLLEAVESELRRRRFGDVVRLEVSASASRKMLDRLTTGGSRRRERPGLRDRGAARPRRPQPDRRPRPSRTERRALDSRDAAPAGPDSGDGGVLRRAAEGRHPRPSAIRVVPGQLRGVRPGRRRGPRADRHQDDGLPDE